MNKQHILPLLVLAGTCLNACEGGSGEGLDSNGLPVNADTPSNTVQPSPTTPTARSVDLATIQNEIFTPNCALSGCHLGASAFLGLRLDSITHSFNTLVNVDSVQNDNLQRVNPGDPDTSYLIQKIEGNPEISGQRMPLIGQALNTDQITLVRDWISQGATNSTDTSALQVQRAQATTQAESFHFQLAFNKPIDESSVKSSLRVYLIYDNTKTLATINEEDIIINNNQITVLYHDSLQYASAIELELNHPALGVVVSALGQQLDGNNNGQEGGLYSYVYSFR